MLILDLSIDRDVFRVKFLHTFRIAVYRRCISHSILLLVLCCYCHKHCCSVTGFRVSSYIPHVWHCNYICCSKTSASPLVLSCFLCFAFELTSVVFYVASFYRFMLFCCQFHSVSCLSFKHYDSAFCSFCCHSFVGFCDISSICTVLFCFSHRSFTHF